MERPITIAISALGGQGGGVLTNWLVSLAENCGHYAQATSVPGVAQRTGATIYYLEISPKTTKKPADDKMPVMALMPMPHDVDIVVAAELMEAGRAIQRQFITPDKTTLITSSHRVYSIWEKMALGDGRGDSDAIMSTARQAARKFIAFDMEQLAADTGCVISSVMLGAIAGAGVLPFSPEDFKNAIRAEGKMVEANLRGFEAGCQAAKTPSEQDRVSEIPDPVITGKANTPAGAALIKRINALPETARKFAYAGARKLLDFQDMDYAADYITTLEKFAAQDREPHKLTRELARYLALWMAFDDVIKVADIKTRSGRVKKYRAEVRATEGQIVHMVEYMHPRIEEIIGTMPVGMANLVRKSPLLIWFFRKFTGPRLSDTTKISSFLMLYFLASLKSIRRKTSRFLQEYIQITTWLDRIRDIMKTDYDLAVEIIRCQRLIKGYGETHRRGMDNFLLLMAMADSDEVHMTAQKLAALQKAALADEDGQALNDLLVENQGNIRTVDIAPTGD